MALKLKICGITRLEDARYCAGAGTDYLGFIQYPESPRYIEPGAAREIIQWIYGPESVGVFVNTSAAAINRIADEAGFGLAQVHGNAPPGLLAAVERPVIRAFSVGPDTDLGALRTAFDEAAEWVEAFLLDTRRAGVWGGTGETFDWDLAAALATDYPVFLAGGLHAGNIASAVERVQPYGLDVSSRLEASPGVKDFDELAAFFEAFDTLREASAS